MAHHGGPFSLQRQQAKGRNKGVDCNLAFPQNQEEAIWNQAEEEGINILMVQKSMLSPLK